jgi:cytochrome c oxidase subunit II
MFPGPSDTAGKVESSFAFIVVSAVILLAIVVFFMILFLIKYRRKRHPVPETVKDSVLLEVIWTAIPTALVMVMFYFGWTDFRYIRNPPKDAMEVNVTARQWSWLFEYRNGKKSGVLRVPLNRPVKLILTSRDVIHSFYVPAYRIKEDCVPGMKTHLWFTPNESGTYDVLCTEYCGVGHSHMRSSVVVMAPAEFDAWYRSAEAAAAGKGLQLLQEKGCLGCHTTDGSRKVGPTFKGIFGRKVTVITNGKERDIIVDEEYLRRSIINPGADIVKGYPPVMPELPLTKDELQEIVVYLKELK